MRTRLIYVVGASGSGKDTLMGHARQKLAGDPRVCFAHRYITRPATAGGENHVALTMEEFTARQNNRLFAMHWSSHGLQYGIGIEINQWLAKGITVVINGSREYLDEARQRYQELMPVTIDVATDVLRDRLLARGREDAESIEQRLHRHETLRLQPVPGVLIQNNGPIEVAGEALARLIAEHTQGTAACV